MLSRSSSTTALLARLARGMAFAASTLWLLGACCSPLDGDCEDPPPVDGGPEAGECDEPGACPIANCDVDTITDTPDGLTCATCPSDAGEAQICGFPETARCESRENSRGEGCSICATDFGQILYDSCFTTDPGQELNCERSEQPVPAGEPGVVEELVCETCTDGKGNVVSTKCEPVSDECHEEGVCRVCTREGEVVVRDCEQPIITPRSCEAYENELGRCVDCFGENDELLTHFCTLAEDTFISCSDSVTPEGLLCTSCFDQNGVQIDRFCDDVDPTLQQCALLEYSEQSCVVCLGVDGSPAFNECQRNDCAPAVDGEDICPSPPDCEFEFGDFGELCRTCPTDAGELEQQCIFETNLQCEELFDEFTQGVCLSCKDIGSGVEVFRRCDNGSLPPACFFQDDGTGTGNECEVCVDSATGDQVYAACIEQTCYDVGDYDLFGAQGNALFVENTRAVADCSECAFTNADGVTTADDYQAVCTLRTDCAVDLVNPNAACEGTVSFTVRPQLCENPWQVAGFQSGFEANALEMLDIMSFALDTAGVAVVAVRYQGVDPNTPPEECVDDQCGCVRGDVVEIVVRPDEASGIVGLFEGILDRCVADADCREGTTCRNDGGCG